MWLRKITKLAVLALLTPASVSLHALSANDSPLPPSAMADKVVLLKSYRKLLLMRGDEVLKTYIVSLGDPIGPKIRQGDHKTPEGIYILDRHNANSQFHRSIHISYPNADDLARARKLRVSPGGELFIHGLPNEFHGHSDALGDWTEGCIAVTNAEIDEIWRAVPDGTPIEIKP